VGDDVMTAVPMSRWRWDGHAGHFVASRSCGFRLSTRIGDYRISTVGDYYPDGWEDEKPKEIGLGRTHETFVFRVSGPGEGEAPWSEIDTDVYHDCEAARGGHMAMCRKYARIAGGEA
jgi:hypothetical protein